MTPEAIRGLDNEQLRTLHVNCLNKLDDIRLRDRAEALLAVVHEEFGRRHVAAGSEDFVPMLAYVGYNVRYHELSDSARRNLLDLVLRASLPPVNSPDYMQRWGAPGSPQRHRQLRDTIALYLKRYGGKETTELAAARWEDDLAYLDGCRP